jgi:hypothetical protein
MRDHRSTHCWLSILAVVLLALPVRAAEPAASAPASVDFDRQVRPILSDRCFKCHGPDANERQAELRLDLPDQALLPAESGKPAIVPGKPQESTLIKRVFSTRKGFMMPPPSSNKTLTAEEKALLKEWIAQGARYQAHWSFNPPRRPDVPTVKDAAWLRNPIDRFILAKLEAEGLRPAPEASRTSLVRRLTFDLTGLPPTLAEIDAFLADDRPDAYERLVDRLLGSEHYGERLAIDWLDAARYADTHGYHLDSGRDMTRWREWVIEAFNTNMPFDRFTVEQLAGDLLPSPTLSQRIASGFNRNHMINFEGGAIPKEYQTAYVIDRVNTTGTVWLGLTIGCSQCHDHKFDPITQKEYYQLYAFFNNVPEKGLDGRAGNAAPMVKTPSAAQARRLERLSAEVRRVEVALNGPRPEIDALQAQWEQAGALKRDAQWVPLDPEEFTSRNGAQMVKLGDRSIVVRGEAPSNDAYTIVAPASLERVTAVRLEALPDERQAARGTGRSDNGNFVLTEFRISAGQPLKIKEARADFSQSAHPVGLAIDGKAATGWAVHPDVSSPHAAIFELETPLEASGGVRLTTVLEFQSQWPRHQLARFRLSATSAPRPEAARKLPPQVAKLLAIPLEKRTDAQRSELRSYYRTQVSPECRPLAAELAALRKELAAVEKAIPSSMVMEEMSRPRDTFVLDRGQYDKEGEKVRPGVPASLPPLPPGAPANRLGLARWLVDPGHPLTARVMVNRLWQMVFGTGIVKTAEDFGSQGELPSHPELLDWLAVEFQQGWDVKALVRLMVTSAAYRQSSVASPEAYDRDPENRLLARGPRVRLQAEFIRDQALAASGLLDGRVGGRSVSPYQPAGLWEELASRLDSKNWSAQTYVQDHGADLYRRTMYTFWKRTSPPPSLLTFDAPDRESCTVRRSRTNTPLQALVLLNDPTYVEAARKMAERVIVQGGSSDDERLVFAFRLATARRPSAAELGVLRTLLKAQRDVYRADAKAALRLLAVGESPRDARLEPAELAAWSMVCSAILNLDETVTKG